MKKTLVRILRMAPWCLGAAAVPKVCLLLGTNRSTGAMLTVLAALAVATFGDWILALTAASSGILAFSWYFIDGSTSLAIRTSDGAVTFGTMAVTALTGTLLALRAQRRAEEAEGRRRQFERMTKLAQRLVAGQNFRDVAQAGVSGVTELFGLAGARLCLKENQSAFQSGRIEGLCLNLPLRVPREAVLELFGKRPPAEVCTALAGMMSLYLERSMALEERARTEAEKRGETLRATVLNALAHDFKTPLTSIKVAASMLRSGQVERGKLPVETERELIEVVDEEADRLERLLRESLELARMDVKRRTPGDEECEIPDIVERVRGKMARYVGRREFVVTLPDDLPRVKGDAFLFEQMLTQVADNAWKYSEPGSRIEISAEDTGGDRLMLTVRNEGSQIPDSEKELIFDKFYRGSNQRSRSEGSGLGLAIARNIVETYGGRINLDAEPLGPAFHFELLVAGGARRKLRALTGGRTALNRQA